MALWMPGWYRCVNRRIQQQQSEDELLRQREKINRSLDVLEGYLVDGTLKTDTVNLALSPLPVPSDISISAALRQVGVSTAHT